MVFERLLQRLKRIPIKNKNVESFERFWNTLDENKRQKYRQGLEKLFKNMSNRAQEKFITSAGWIAHYTLEGAEEYIKLMLNNKSKLEELIRSMNNQVQKEFVEGIGWFAAYKGAKGAEEYINFMWNYKNKLEKLFTTMNNETQAWLVGEISSVASKNIKEAEKYVNLMEDNKELFRIMNDETQRRFIWWVGFIASYKGLRRAREYVKLLKENEDMLKKLFRVMSYEVQARFVGGIGGVIDRQGTEKAKKYVRFLKENSNGLEKLFRIMNNEAQDMFVEWIGETGRYKDPERVEIYLKFFRNMTNKRIKPNELIRIIAVLEKMSLQSEELNVLNALVKKEGDVYARAAKLLDYLEKKRCHQSRSWRKP